MDIIVNLIDNNYNLNEFFQKKKGSQPQNA